MCGLRFETDEISATPRLGALLFQFSTTASRKLPSSFPPLPARVKPNDTILTDGQQNAA